MLPWFLLQQWPLQKRCFFLHLSTDLESLWLPAQVFTETYLYEDTSNYAGQTPLSRLIAGSVQAETRAGTVHRPQNINQQYETSWVLPENDCNPKAKETGTTKAHLRVWKQLELTW